MLPMPPPATSGTRDPRWSSTLSLCRPDVHRITAPRLLILQPSRRPRQRPTRAARPRTSAETRQERRQRLREGLRLLHVRQVRGRLEDLELRSRDLGLDRLRRGDRRALILLADDDERRELDGRQAIGEIERRDRGAAA